MNTPKISYSPQLAKVLSLISIFFCFWLLPSCDAKKSDSAGGSYVKPSVDYKGKTRRGHVRKKVSTDKNAIKNQNRSRYYYRTRGKYRRKKD
jgi:hypothetical protein